MRFSKLIPVALVLFATSTSGQQLREGTVRGIFTIMNDKLVAMRRQVASMTEQPQNPNHYYTLLDSLIQMKHDWIDSAFSFGTYDATAECRNEQPFTELEAGSLIAAADAPDGPLRNCEHLFYEIYHVLDQLPRDSVLCVDAVLRPGPGPIEALTRSIAAVLRNFSNRAAIANMGMPYNNLRSWFPADQADQLRDLKGGCEFNLRAAADKWASPRAPPTDPPVEPTDPPAKRGKRCLGLGCQA